MVYMNKFELEEIMKKGMTVKNTWYDWYDWSIKRKLEDIINDLQKPETWKIQLIIAINFISSKDIDEERLMHSKSDNIEVMAYDKSDEFIEKLFEPLFHRFQIELKTLVRGSDFIFDSVYCTTNVIN